MRSFNYLHTRFAHGDDFVCDAPDAVASSVELLLAELPPPRASVDSGAIALDEGLGTLVFVRRSRPASTQPASPLGARRESSRREFVHALVLSGHHPPERVEAAKRLLLERYAPDPAAEIATLCRRLQDLELVQAARLVSERFVDPEPVRELCQEAAPPRRPLWRPRDRSPSISRAVRALRERLTRAGRGVSKDVGSAALALDRSGRRAADATRSHLRRGGHRIHAAVGSAQARTTLRLTSLLRSVADSTTRELGRIARISPWAVSGAAFLSSAFLLGYALALPPMPPTLPERPVLPPVESAPPLRCEPEVAEVAKGPRLDTGTVSLQADLAAAISRLEALELRADDPDAVPAPTRATARVPTPAVAAAPVERPEPAEVAARPRPHQRHARVVADVLVVRAGPGTTYAEIGRLEQGTSVRAASREREGWTRIAEPVGGWVASRYLRE